MGIEDMSPPPTGSRVPHRMARAQKTIRGRTLPHPPPQSEFYRTGEGEPGHSEVEGDMNPEGDAKKERSAGGPLENIGRTDGPQMEECRQKEAASNAKAKDAYEVAAKVGSPPPGSSVPTRKSVDQR